MKAFGDLAVFGIELHRHVGARRGCGHPASAASPAAVIERIERQSGERDAAMVAAHASGGYSRQQIGAHFGVHITTVAKVVRQAKGV